MTPFLSVRAGEGEGDSGVSLPKRTKGADSMNIRLPDYIRTRIARNYATLRLTIFTILGAALLFLTGAIRAR